ncbi:MAG: ADP-forming succinate--CoA ligase subunit beta [Chloroflexota bacterium]|nr:ADP-forming succinate--CoA ligase subunit beta [Chloroflexota bacterium]
MQALRWQQLKLHEHQSRQLLAHSGIPVPAARLAADPAAAARAAAELGGPVVIKAQVLSGGRGKAGGVKLANDADGAAAAAAEILGLEIGGNRVENVMVAEAVDIAAEYYLAALPDRESGQLMVMASAAGGIEIETVAAQDPEAIRTVGCGVDSGLAPHQARRLAFQLDIPLPLLGDFIRIATATVDCLVSNDASLVEINPLVQSGDRLLAIDAKITIDDSALFRQPQLREMRNPEEETATEAEARNSGISYVKLDGTIGCMVNGAGLAMALLDVIVSEGGEPANFLDVGGGADAGQVAKAMNLILADPEVEVVLVNIFGGITRCDDVAHGIVQALDGLSRRVPLEIRLVGTNQAEGLKILREAGLNAHRDMLSAVRAAVALAG